MVETSACKALEVLGPVGSAQFRCRGYDVVPIAPRWDPPETMVDVGGLEGIGGYLWVFGIISSNFLGP